MSYRLKVAYSTDIRFQLRFRKESFRPCRSMQPGENLVGIEIEVIQPLLDRFFWRSHDLLAQQRVHTLARNEHTVRRGDAPFSLRWRATHDKECSYPLHCLLG